MVATFCFRFVAVLSLASAAICVGCNESDKKQDASVQGTVTVDGELAGRGTVAFHPVDEGPAVYGSIHENGTFALRIGQGNPSAPDHSLIYSGEYVATVVVRAESSIDEEHGESGPPKPGMLLSAAKYSNQATSGLKFTIKSGTNVIDVPLEGAINDEVLDADEADSSEENPGSEDTKSTELDVPLETNSTPEETDEPADNPAVESDQ